MKLFLKILLIILWVGLAAGSILLMGFANKNHEVRQCSGLDIRLDYSGKEPLFKPADLKQQLVGKFGKFEKKTLDQLEVEKIIAFLQQNPNIEYADAHITIEGRIVVDIRQCIPLVRLVSQSGENFYLDEKGKVLPANPDYPARVIVANGNISVPFKPGKSIFPGKKKQNVDLVSLQSLYDIHMLAGKLAADSVLNSLVEQIYIKPDGSIRLATKAGSHIIEFGDTSSTDEKFENLKAFYKYGLSKIGWQKYRIVNLTYKNQVVCTK
jgi:cell division protein FtsQ